MNMKKPPIITPQPLKPGDTVGFAAPASPFDIIDFAKGLAIYRRFGLRPVIPAEILNVKGYLSGSDSQRAETLERLFDDSAIHAIVCVRGGYGCLRLLEKLRWDQIKKHPKRIVGFSDVTALLNTIYLKTGMVTYHGPTAASLSHLNSDSVDALFNMLMGKEPTEMILKEPKIIFPGMVMAPLVGGNLTTLCHMVGTPFSPCFNGHILFLEDRGEAVYRIDRMLTQLKMSGALLDVRGIVLGEFSDCGDERQLFALFHHVFKDMNIPVLAGFPIGHGTQNITLPIGAMAMLDTHRGGLFLIQTLKATPLEGI
jgi:muramoyltetrapeptide carboxypeptidase